MIEIIKCGFCHKSIIEFDSLTNLYLMVERKTGLVGCDKCMGYHKYEKKMDINKYWSKIDLICCSKCNKCSPIYYSNKNKVYCYLCASDISLVDDEGNQILDVNNIITELQKNTNYHINTVRREDAWKWKLSKIKETETKKDR
jgi:hypothetical protein